MLNFIKRLSDSDFVDLLVAVNAMKYGDKKGFEYSDSNTNIRHVHVWDNYSNFKDSDAPQYFCLDDYSISKQDGTVDHHVFMLNQFGEEWYKKAQSHFIKHNAHDRLAMLQVAKDRYEAELAMDNEVVNEINS